MPDSSSWKPSRKVLAAAIVGLLTVASHAVASGGFDATEAGELIALAISLTTAYLISNKD